MPAIVFDEIILILVYSEGMEYLDIYKHIVEWANPEESQRECNQEFSSMKEGLQIAGADMRKDSNQTRTSPLPSY